MLRVALVVAATLHLHRFGVLGRTILTAFIYALYYTSQINNRRRRLLYKFNLLISITSLHSQLAFIIEIELNNVYDSYSEWFNGPWPLAGCLSAVVGSRAMNALTNVSQCFCPFVTQF